MFKLIAGKKYVRRNGAVVILTHYGHNTLLLTDGKWLFNPNHPDVDGYRILLEPDLYDIVAPYKATRKASSPYKKILTVKDGDTFLLNGEKFIVSEYANDSPKELQEKVSLTSLERKSNSYYPYVHIRDNKNKALFSREELIDLLRSGEYAIK